MKLAILSDIHANLEALEAVLAEVDERAPDAICCLGDIVGYGADPAPCLQLIRDRCDVVVQGNHDVAVGANRNVDALPRDGRTAAEYHREQLSEEQRTYLSELPLRTEAYGCTFVHATPKSPASWHRLTSFNRAQEQFDHFETDICFIGHTHIPAVLSNKLGVLRVRPGNRYLVNAGSVGQPRDHNPRACVGFLNTEAVDYELVRVPYDVERAADKIREAGLPDRLAERLQAGQ